MNNYQAIADALINALQSANTAQQKANNTGLLNTNASINNQSNASGTLYSTQPSFRQTQAAADVVQKNAKLDNDMLTGKLGIQSNILDTQYKIEAMNRAAAQMDKVQFYI